MKNANIKKLTGTHRPDREKPFNSCGQPPLTKPPKSLKGEARKEFMRITKLVNHLTQTDLGVLILYCKLFEKLNEEGLSAAEMSQFRGTSSSLGLDAAARSKMSLPSPKLAGKENKIASLGRG